MPESSEPVAPWKSGVVPLSIERAGDTGIVISWSDGETSQWTVKQLRDVCPCATCREKERGATAETPGEGKPAMLPILSAEEARPLRIESMNPVGTYAYSIAFSDGHSSGIFPMAMLRGVPDRAG